MKNLKFGFGLLISLGFVPSLFVCLALASKQPILGAVTTLFIGTLIITFYWQRAH